MEAASNRMAELREHARGLDALASSVSNPELFTDAEREEVAGRVRDTQNEITQESKAFDAHYEGLLNNLTDIRTRISKRREVLEASPVLEKDSALCDFFAKKQVELEDQLKAMVDQLESFVDRSDSA